MVSTFDKLTYKLPAIPAGCQVVVAKDCSPNNLFTILFSTQAGIKTVKVIVPNNEVAVNVVGGWNHDINVIVNGNAVYVGEGEAKKVTLEIAGNMKPIVAEIIKAAGLISIKCHALGIEVHMTTDSISVHVSLS